MKIAALALALCACSNEVDRSSEALGEIDGNSARSITPGSQEILDVRADGAILTGILAPAIENTDEERILILHSLFEGAPIDSAIEGMRVTDARFAHDSIVVIGEDCVLRVYVGGIAHAIDTNVYGPMSVSGTRVVYTRGEIPSLELVRADVATGIVTTLTHDMAPVWSPAISEDGERIAFVSGASGSPRIHVLDREGLHVLPATARFPSSPRAPRLVGNVLSFEDEQGERASIDLGEITP